MATILTSPAAIPTNSTVLQGIFLTLPAAGWVQGTTVWTLSGVAGVTLVSSYVSASGVAKLGVTTGATAGTLTISDGTNTGTVAVQAMPFVRRKWFAGLTDRRPR